MIPTITLMSTIPPMILLLLKGMLVLPPICIMLSRVRSGKPRPRWFSVAPLSCTAHCLPGPCIVPRIVPCTQYNSS